MATTRDDVLADIKDEVCKVLPENVEVDGDDLDRIKETVEEVLDNCCEAIDAVEDEEDEAPTTE